MWKQVQHREPFPAVERIFRGDLSIADWSWVEFIKRMVGEEVQAQWQLCSFIGLLVIASQLLTWLRQTDSVGKVEETLQFLLLLVSFCAALTSLQDVVIVVSEWANFVRMLAEATVPLLTGLLLATGAIVSAAMFHPFVIALVWLGVTATIKWLIPLNGMVVLVELLNELTDEFPLTKLAALIRRATIWLLGLFMAAFSAALSLQTVVSATTDGLALKTAKWIGTAAIPVVGQALSNAFDVAFRTALYTSNGVVVVSFVIVFFIALVPLVKLIVTAGLYQLVGALLQPFGSTKVTTVFDVLARCYFLYAALVAVVSLLFCLLLLAIVLAGHTSMMMR